MKKFKKPLLINVPQDDHHEAKSPSRILVKENKQKSLLLFNQHTISSSVNNEDDFHQEDEKGIHGCEEFTEYHSKEIYQKKTGISAKQGQQVNSNKLQRHKKFNIIQFEEFMVQGGQKSKLNQTGQVQQRQRRYPHNNYHKRQFSIQIPQEQQKQQSQRQQRPNQMSIKFAFDLKNNQIVQKSNKVMKQNVMKQPPAPSNKSNQGKSLSRRFVFPTNDEEEIIMSNKNNQDLVNTNTTTNNTNNNNKQKQSINIISISQQQHDSIISQLHMEYKQKLQQMSKSFQKQRQQFYKQKSRLQKDLMIKDGQIQMLQRLITNRYSPTNSTNSNLNQNQQQLSSINNNNYGNNHIDINHNLKRQSLSQSISIEKSKHLYVSDQKVTAMETIILQKDLQINSLLQKINQLNSFIDQKNNQLQEVKIGLMKSQKMNQSLRNQIFIHQKKQQSQKLTKQFYKVKQTLIQVQKSTKTPKASHSRPKWQQDQSLQRDKQLQKADYPFRGIDDLHKRLQSLKMNRIELQSRGRIKSEMNYPQTSKNKTKGTFDFKGKFYERERDYNLRGGPY